MKKEEYYKKLGETMIINAINIGGCPIEHKYSHKVPLYEEMINQGDINIILETGCTNKNPTINEETH